MFPRRLAAVACHLWLLTLLLFAIPAGYWGKKLLSVDSTQKADGAQHWGYGGYGGGWGNSGWGNSGWDNRGWGNSGWGNSWGSGYGGYWGKKKL
jgi:hypothetical protein